MIAPRGALRAGIPFISAVRVGEYWIIDVAPDYSYAVNGEPRRQYLWVLARSPLMDDATLQRLLKGAAAQGYDPARAVRTPRTENE